MSRARPETGRRARTRPVSAVAGIAIAAGVAPAVAALPPVKHVFIIVLENKDYEQSFGPMTEAPNLARELTKQGQLLPNYYGTSHASLGNYLSMISGQAVNPDTQGDCAAGFKDVVPGTAAADGQVVGAGCVYPAHVKTITEQLDAKGLRWRGYMEDMGTACRHPALNAVDDTNAARADDQYATRHNPFVYLHSIIDDQRRCEAGVVDLKLLLDDLADPSRTPAYAFITPDLCSDGHDEPSIDGRPGGLASADAFLKEWVPRILAAPAYADGGLLLITWDEANIDPDSSTACCNQPAGPNTLLPGILGAGGGRTGTVVLTPYTAPGSVNETPYNHFSLLRSVEDLFGLEHLGYAGLSGLKAFGDDVFNARPAPAPGPLPVTLPACTAARTGAVAGQFAIERRGKRVYLRFLGRRSGRVTLTVGRGRRMARRVRACVLHRVRLPGRHGAVRIRGGGRTKRVRY